jgi:hypothetical protein
MPNWIWCRDDTTGAHYDVEESALRSGMTPVEGYPTNSGPGARPRETKPFIGKDGLPGVPAERTEAEPDAINPPATPADNTEEQQS